LEDIYEFFGIPKNASLSDIKSAFRRLSKEFHPDAGGNRAEFEKLCKYYKILSNANLRKSYDSGEYSEDNYNISEYIIGIIFGVIEQNNPEITNIISKAGSIISERIRAYNSAISSLKAKKKKYEKFLGSLSEKSDNFLSISVKSHIDSIDLDVVLIKKDIEFNENCLDFIRKNYEYYLGDIDNNYDFESLVLSSASLKC